MHSVDCIWRQLYTCLVLLCLLVPRFQHKQEKTECSLAEVQKGLLPSIQDCARACFGVSSMFIYGTNPRRCYVKDGKTLCVCYCELSANTDANCTKVDHSGYDLYAFNGKLDSNQYQWWLKLLTEKIPSILAYICSYIDHKSFTLCATLQQFALLHFATSLVIREKF